MNRRVLWVVVGLLVLTGAGAALMLWNRAQDRSPSTKRAAERLLIGFQPQMVKRVRFRVGKREVELAREQAGWEPVVGSTAAVGVRVDVLLGQLATLKVRPAKARGRKRVRRPTGRPAGEVRVWRGRARILVIRLYRHRGGLLLTTTDRPGLYRADRGLLQLLEREVGRPALPRALTLKPGRLASLELVSTGRVMLIRKTGRWFVEEDAALAPADPETVGKLLRVLLEMRITHRVAKGSAALTRHGLDRPALRIKADDGTKHALRLGGRCPRGKGALLAALGSKEVVCVTAPDPKALAGPFLNNRLFSAAPDELKAASVTRGKRTLAVVNRPGGGGWTKISPNLGKVDQAAAAGFVSQLSKLRGQAPPDGLRAPPAKAKRIGAVVLTPLVGRDERVELWAPRSGAPLWVRRIGGSRWFTLRAADAQWVAADPVVLRPRSVCAARVESILRVVKTGATPVTEVVAKEGPNWRFVLLRGRQTPQKAGRIAGALQEYRTAKAKGRSTVADIGWKKPVLLVGKPDRALFGTLLHQAARIRATRFVSGRVSKAHGFGKRALRLTYVYQHDCKKQGGKKTCQQAACAVELGATLPEGGCYARRRGGREVFVAHAALCRAFRAPLANRKAVSLSMHRLSTITLGAGARTRTLSRAPSGGWKRPADIAPVKWETGAGVLLTLAPLTTSRVAGYGGVKGGKPLVTARLYAPNVPPIELRFHSSDDPGAKHVWLVKKGLPVRYRVPRRIADALVKLTLGR